MLADVIGTVTSTDDVVTAMRAIDAALPDTDGVKWFNYLYLKVTEAVLADASAWQDWAFLQRFDVVFAGLYFDAVVKWERDQETTPHAWRPLLRARFDRGLARLQFALAGMNAHINHDLAMTLDAMAGQEGGFPPRDGARFSDFTRVNDILERVEAELRGELATGLIEQIDLTLGDLDSIVVMWKVRRARDAAWTNGEVLWRLRALPALQRDFLLKLDQITAFAGRGLLLPRLGMRRSLTSPA
jgi:hypothetical protein